MYDLRARWCGPVEAGKKLIEFKSLLQKNIQSRRKEKDETLAVQVGNMDGYPASLIELFGSQPEEEEHQQQEVLGSQEEEHPQPANKKRKRFCGWHKCKAAQSHGKARNVPCTQMTPDEKALWEKLKGYEVLASNSVVGVHRMKDLLEEDARKMMKQDLDTFIKWKFSGYVKTKEERENWIAYFRYNEVDELFLRPFKEMTKKLT